MPNRAVALAGSYGGYRELIRLGVELAANAMGKKGWVPTEQGDITRHLRDKAASKAVDSAYRAAGADPHKRDMVRKAAELAVKDLNDRRGEHSKLQVSTSDPSDFKPDWKLNETYGHAVLDQEVSRVKSATTSAKRFGSMLGVGKTAKSITSEAVVHPHAMEQGIRIAIDNEAKVSRVFSEIRHLGERVASLVDTGGGILDINRKSMGMPTNQGDISRKLEAKAEGRAQETARQAASRSGKLSVVNTAITRRGIEIRDRQNRGR